MKLNFTITVTKEELKEWGELNQFQNEEDILDDIHDWIIGDITVFIQDTDVEMIIEN